MREEGRVTGLLFAALMLAAAGTASGQSPEWKVFLLAHDGFLAVDEVRTAATIPGFAATDARVRRTLVDDVNRLLRGLGRLCNQAFNLDPGAECPTDAAQIRGLTTASWAAVRTAWSEWRQAVPTRPGLEGFFNDNADAIVSLGRRVPALTALTFDAGVDTLDVNQGALTFEVVPAVRAWSFGPNPEDGRDHVLVHDLEQGPRLLEEKHLRGLLDPLVGRPWRRESIESAIEKRYPSDRVLRSLAPNDVVFAVKADPDRRQVEIHEGARLAGVEVAPGVDDALAGRALYLVLPVDQFLALGSARRKMYAPGERPLLGPELTAQQAQLKAIGLVMGLVEDPSLGGARMMRIERDSSTDNVEPALPAWVRVEGGARYRPEQGVHALSRVIFQNVGSQPQTLEVSAGGTNAGGLGDANYSRDFLFFTRLHRRMSLAVQGASESEYQRLLAGVDTNERRWSATAHADLEWIPDRTGTSLAFWLEGERTAIVLSGAGARDSTVNIAALNGGARFSRRTRTLGLQRAISLESRLHAGVPFGELPSFFVASASVNFAHELGLGIEAHIIAGAATASVGTPFVEQPVLGGAETIRGYRKDEAIGRRAWHIQNEVWLPLPIVSRSGPLDWLRRNLKAAPFLDAGALYRATQGAPGTRFGAGGGLRIQATKGLYLKADYGYGLGVVPRERQGRAYLGADLGF